MHWLPSFEIVISALSTLAAAFLAARLLYLGLSAKYRFLLAYLIWTVVSAPAMLAVALLRPLWYLPVYIAGECISVALMLLIVLEVFTLILQRCPGIARLTSIYVRAAVILCALGAGTLLLFERHSSNPWVMFQLFKQTVYSSGLAFVLLITAFLLWYPVRVNRNTAIYATGFSIYFSCETAFLLLLNMARKQERIVSPVLMIASGACLVYWGIRLTRAGEELPVSGTSWKAGDEGMVLEQIRGLSRGFAPVPSAHPRVSMKHRSLDGLRPRASAESPNRPGTRRWQSSAPD